MLLRPSATGFDVYMVRRNARSAFAPDAFVFPGGAVDRADRDPATRARVLGIDAARLDREFRFDQPRGAPDPGTAQSQRAAIAIAALRELFEESGILLACDAHGLGVGAEALDRAAAHRARHAVRDGRQTFAAFLEAHDWFGDARALTLFSRWITPQSEPRRFDAHFFVALAPAGQAARSDDSEVHDGAWIAPQTALERHRAGAFHLVYPTVKHLERLASFDSADALVAFARSKPIVTIAPDAHPDAGYVMPETLERAW